MPSQCLSVPSQEEVKSRWPGKAPEEVDAVQADYNRESELLEVLELEDVYHRVRELVVADVWDNGN